MSGKYLSRTLFQSSLNSYCKAAMEQRKRIKLIPPKCSRKIYFVRHAERVDLTYGYNEWFPLCFPNGEYVRADLNMPYTVPKRRNGSQSFRHDTPLTQLGLYQAKLTGEGFKELELPVSYVYCSPALRCIQTCASILEGMGCPGIKINIEPGLFEFLHWYKDIEMPEWMNANELIENGYNVCKDYEQVKRVDDLDKKETIKDFYDRSHNVMQVLIDRLAERPGDILVVGHSATLEACTRQLVGNSPRSYEEMFSLIQDIPYCGLITIHQTLIPTMEICEEEIDVTKERPSTYQNNTSFNYTGEWDFTKNDFPNFSHARRDRFDWHILISEELLKIAKEKNKSKHSAAHLKHVLRKKAQREEQKPTTSTNKTTKEK